MIPPKHEQGSRAPVAEGEKSHKQRLLDGACRPHPPSKRAHAAAASPGAACTRKCRTRLATCEAAGEPYDANDPELVDDRIACRRLLHKYNITLEYDDAEGRAAVLRQLLGSFDEGAAQCRTRAAAAGVHGTAGAARGGAQSADVLALPAA